MPKKLIRRKTFAFYTIMFLSGLCICFKYNLGWPLATLAGVAYLVYVGASAEKIALAYIASLKK